jgi:Tol biopolymer transport system component
MRSAALAAITAACALAVVPDHAAATYPGADGRIAYVGYAYPLGHPARADLFTVLPDGTATERLTDDTAIEAQPAWSPDGTNLVFKSDSGEKGPGIYTIGADGTDRRFVGPSGIRTNVDPEPSFTPSGRRVLYSKRIGNRSALVTVRADGTGGRRVLAAGPLRHVRFSEAEFSPDGRWIVFQGAPEPESQFGIWRMRADGTHARLLDHYQQSYYPDFSPDGQWIVYSRAQYKYWDGLWLMRPDGTDKHPVPNTYNSATRTDFAGGTFAPAGDRIAMREAVVARSCLDIYTISPDGLELRQVTHYSDLDVCEYLTTPDLTPVIFTSDPAWQPVSPP